MRQILFILALAGSTLAQATASSPWGAISGHVVDANTHAPVGNVELIVYRTTGVRNYDFEIMHLRANASGFFVKMPLEPGRYVVLARVPGRVEGCAVDDIIAGEMSRVTVKTGYRSLTCSGPRIDPALVNPNAGGDLYIP
jgi:hypothetical protein